MGWFGGKSKSKQSKASFEKMQHKINLNQQTQKNMYDLTHCEMTDVPVGTYFEVDLHLKTGLNLSNNNLKDLQNGGTFDQLQRISLFNLSFNQFKTLPNDLFPFLCNLSELNLSNNKLQEIPDNIGCLSCLQRLDLERNELKTLPKSIGECKFLYEINLKQNPIEKLPASLGSIGVTLEILEIDESDHLDKSIRDRLGDTQVLLRFLAEKGGLIYNSIKSVPNDKINTNKKLYPDLQQSNFQNDDLEKYLLQTQAENDNAAQLALKALTELDNQAKIEAMKAHEESEKIISETMKILDLEDENSKNLVMKLTEDRAKLMQETTNIMEHEEKMANNLILRILKEQDIEIPSILDKIEKEDKMLDDQLRELIFSDEGIEMEDIIQKDLMENAEMARFLKMHMEDQDNIMKKALVGIKEDEKFIEENVKFFDRINSENAEIISKKIAEDEELLKKMFMSALKARDGEVMKIEADISNIERQLVRMTMIDINEKDLVIKDIMNSERKELTNLLEILHNQLMDREKLIAQTIDRIDQNERDERVDFWLVRYKQILQEKPPELVHLESRLSQIVRDVLMTADCEIYIGLFARHSILEENDLRYLNGDRLESMGIWSVGEQNRILASITKYVTPVTVETGVEVPVAPEIEEKEPEDKEEKSTTITREEPSVVPTAPIVFQTEPECVICLDESPDTIFIPCGHVVCCKKCLAKVTECPICRTLISKKLPLSM